MKSQENKKLIISLEEKNKDLEDRLNLTYVALRLYIESETSKLIADAIMNKLSKMVLPKEVFKESKKEVKGGADEL